ncbi:hypothetical protein [Vibrio diazotrophicus]|uniref:hypothetical protein n=1 Tax=Vibrio diazotrophicus TaxID=685 RepID=UPI00142DBAC0|nr:hypothetical protein [Vibrio diazotrophicus]NIY91531.1 hypothetical protein [Vibrio diazotrophicus]
MFFKTLEKIFNAHNKNDLFNQPQADLFSQPTDVPEIENQKNCILEESISDLTAVSAVLDNSKELQVSKSSTKAVPKDSFYELFVQYLQVVAREPITESELVEASGLHRGQVKNWLSIALEQKLITKLTKPVRYKWIDEK